MTQDCLDKHFKTEDLEVHGECEQACCKQEQPTKKFLGMSYLPSTLMVVLKRYEWVVLKQYDPVLNKQVDTPEQIKVSLHADRCWLSFLLEQSAVIGIAHAVCLLIKTNSISHHDEHAILHSLFATGLAAFQVSHV